MSNEVTESDNEMRKRHGLTVQPEPENNDNPSAHDLLIQDLDTAGFLLNPRASYDDIEIFNTYSKLSGSLKKISWVLEKSPEDIINRRKQFGLEKYGTTLQPHNGRNNLEDALDEIVDALVYIRCELFERDVM